MTLKEGLVNARADSLQLLLCDRGVPHRGGEVLRAPLSGKFARRDINHII